MSMSILSRATRGGSIVAVLTVTIALSALTGCLPVAPPAKPAKR